MIAQIFIALFGVTAIFLSQSPNEWAKKHACLFGLASQPFWIAATVSAEQWGMVALCGFYTLAWLRGFKTHWLQK